jgi:hypothetical protein
MDTIVLENTFKKVENYIKNQEKLLKNVIYNLTFTIVKDKKINIYELKNIVNSEVETPEGKATLKEIYVTELGYIMAKVYYPSRGVFINHMMASVRELLGEKNISLLSGFSEKIILEEKLID